MEHRQKRTSLRHLREHLVCVLCGGYLIDATTIVECLHSFCKTCIVRYLDSSKFCPICDVQVHKTKPLVNIRMDHTLQDMVYKLVPGLFQEEMKRRREFYREKVDDDDNNGPWPEYYIDDDGEVKRERVIFSNDEQISLSLHLSTDGKPPKSPDKRDYKGSMEMTDCRYLLCPAAVTISHLKKFIRLKFNLCDRYQIDIYHTDEILKDHYTLMDIAYIYVWRRKGPLRLFYTVYTNPAKRIKRSLSSTVTSDVANDTSIVEMAYSTKTLEHTDQTDKQISSSVQNSTKMDDSLPKTESNKSESTQLTKVSSSSNCGERSISEAKSTNHVDKMSDQTAHSSSADREPTRSLDIPKKKEVSSCASINVPSPHRSFLLGPRQKDKSEKKHKDSFPFTKPREQILSLPVKHPVSKVTDQHNKSAEPNSKSLPVSKLPNSSNNQSNSKNLKQNTVSESSKVVNNSSTGNINSDKNGSAHTSISNNGCTPTDAKKAKLHNQETSTRTVAFKNGGSNTVSKPIGHPYLNKPEVNHVGNTLSSADKTRKLLHIPERPIHAYVPMAHYQGMNGLFHYRAHMQDYGNDAPQDLSMKKKTNDMTDTNGKTPKTNNVSEEKVKEKEKDKNGEIDKYAFTDDDVIPLTSRKLQHVKSEPVSLN